MNVIHGDCLEELKKLEDNSIDAVVCDPPYGLSNTKPQQVADVLKAWVTGDTVSVPAKRGGFMGKDWDSFVPPPAVWEECMRVLKPGGHMAVFAGARTQDLMGLSIRLAGFEIRDTLGWVYGCLSEDTEVLINGKWEKYHEAKPGDLALCYDREHDTYEWQPIEDTHKYEYGDTAYRIHSNNTDQIVSRNHRVLVERGGTYEFEYAENLAREHQIRVPILESVQTLLDDLPMRESQPGGKEPILQRELRNVRPSTGCSETDGETRSNGDCVCGLRNESLQTERLAKAGGNSDVFQRVQREVARGGMEEARTQRPSGMVGGNRSAVRGEYARGEQPSLEGRGDVETPEGELQGCSVCEVPAGVPEHVAEGWVCDGTSSSGGARNREALGENRGCASCEPRAGGQSVGEPVSVRVESGSQAVRGARYTVADLAGIEPVHYEGVVWCLTVPTGAFVVRRNGKVFVTGNSGFPKSMDISKAIDKAAGAEREVLSERPAYGIGGNGILNGHSDGATAKVTAPATNAAKQWDGWGTSLKPAIEPILLCRKPLVGTVASNVLAHGVGGLNIDACRVAHNEPEDHTKRVAPKFSGAVYGYGGKNNSLRSPAPAGRFPANVLLDEHAAKEMDKQSVGTRAEKPSKSGTAGATVQEATWKCWHKPGEEIAGYNDSGGASRFFPVFKYQAKAPKKERPVIEREDGTKIQHNTVKPLALMEWLVSLIVPPGGVVLDPFAGSGTTLQAAINKGFQPIGIEQDADYIKLIEKRLEATCTTHKN